MRHTFLRLLFWCLFVLFCVCYPFSVIGLATNLKPPASISLGGVASFSLYLEGLLVILATGLLYSWRRALSAGVCVIVFTYLVETVGVNTGFPFGAYLYTDILIPRLPGSVPLTVMFAWVLVAFGGNGLVKRSWLAEREVNVRIALLGATMAVLLDLAIEPAAAHVVFYWIWLAPGPYNYYGVPIANFVAWFVVAFMSVLLVNMVLRCGYVQHEQVIWEKAQKMGVTGRLAVLVPCLLFICSLLMFGLVDLTHGYYWGSGLALCAGIMIFTIWGPHVFSRNDQYYGAVRH